MLVQPPRRRANQATVQWGPGGEANWGLSDTGSTIRSVQVGFQGEIFQVSGALLCMCASMCQNNRSALSTEGKIPRLVLYKLDSLHNSFSSRSRFCFNMCPSWHTKHSYLLARVAQKETWAASLTTESKQDRPQPRNKCSSQAIRFHIHRLPWQQESCSDTTVTNQQCRFAWPSRDYKKTRDWSSLCPREKFQPIFTICISTSFSSSSCTPSSSSSSSSFS